MPTTEQTEAIIASEIEFGLTPKPSDAKSVYDYGQHEAKPDVMCQLPPVVEIEQALNMAQAELRAMYKRLGINGSNVLDLVDKTLESVQAAIAS